MLMPLLTAFMLIIHVDFRPSDFSCSSQLVADLVQQNARASIIRNPTLPHFFDLSKTTINLSEIRTKYRSSKELDCAARLNYTLADLPPIPRFVQPEMSIPAPPYPPTTERQRMIQQNRENAVREENQRQRTIIIGQQNAADNMLKATRDRIRAMAFKEISFSVEITDDQNLIVRVNGAIDETD